MKGVKTGGHQKSRTAVKSPDGFVSAEFCFKGHAENSEMNKWLILHKTFGAIVPKVGRSVHLDGDVTQYRTLDPFPPLTDVY